jgi:hypothetical protein
MLYYKRWQECSFGGIVKVDYEGWYLFGFIPLYVRKYIH